MRVCSVGVREFWVRLRRRNERGSGPAQEESAGRTFRRRVAVRAGVLQRGSTRCRPDGGRKRAPTFLFLAMRRPKEDKVIEEKEEKKILREIWMEDFTSSLKVQIRQNLL